MSNDYWSYQLSDDAEYMVNAAQDVLNDPTMVGICVGEEDPPIAYVKAEYADNILKLLNRSFVPIDMIV